MDTLQNEKKKKNQKRGISDLFYTPDLNPYVKQFHIEAGKTKLKHKLLGIQLDNQLFVDIKVDIFTLRIVNDFTYETVKKDITEFCE